MQGTDMLQRFAPWPLLEIRERLSSADTLWRLCQPKIEERGFNTREDILESLVHEVVASRWTNSEIFTQVPIGEVLNMPTREYPYTARPDIVLRIDGRFHVCEIKSSRTDYGRFHNVVRPGPFKEFLTSIGHDGKDPYEVEQDILKLERIAQISPAVASCSLLMVDAFNGRGKTWSKAFSNHNQFLNTMRTNHVLSRAKELLASTVVIPIASGSISANLIMCTVSTNVA